MHSSEVLTDAFERVHETVEAVVDGLGPPELTARIDPEANSIAWLVWHLTRVQDDQIAQVAGTEPLWTQEGWVRRFSLPFDPGVTGYGQRPAEVGEVEGSADLLLGYHDAVHEATTAFVGGLGDDELDRIVDDRFDPPVSLGVRLVSIIDDDLQHVGQAAFVRGVLERT